MDSFFLNFSPLVFFSVGLLAQGFSRILPHFEGKKDLGKLGGSLLISVLLTLDIGSESGKFTSSEILFIFCLIFSICICGFFRKKILSEINELTLLTWNIGLFYITSSYFGLLNPTTLIVFSFLFLAFCIALFRVPLNPVIETLLYVWFMIIGVIVSLVLIPWTKLFEAGSIENVGRFDMFLLGLTLFYTFSYILYLFYFIPFPGKRQSLQERLDQVKEHAQIFAGKYNKTQFHPSTTLVIVAVTGAILYWNFVFQVVSDITLLAILFGLSPLVGGMYNQHFFQKNKIKHHVTARSSK